MKLAGPIYSIIKLFCSKRIPVGKTVVQKIVFFSLPKDERSRYFSPYYYGPFSKTVQSVNNKLIEDNYVYYDKENTCFRILKDREISKLNIDPMLWRRINITIDFLTEQGITKANDIAFLSKVFFFEEQTPGIDVEEFYNYAVKASSIFEWKELASASPNKVSEYRNLSVKLNSLLSSTNAAQVH